jgi:uncharacterized protein YjbI with pentapeptide repeats
MNMSEQIDTIEAKIPELDTLTRLRRWAASTDRAVAQKEVSAYTQQLIDRTGRGMVLREADLRGLNLSGFDLRQAVLNRAVLHGTNLNGADLTGAALVCPGMERTQLKGTIMRGVYMHAFAAQVCDFTGADMSNLTDATGSLFHGCFMTGVKLSGNSIAGTTFYQCIMDEVDFRRSNLQGSVINECHLARADFSGAQLSQFCITKSNCRGVRFNEASGEGLCLQRLVDADGISLAQANLPGLRIRGGSFTHLDARSLSAREADFASLSMPRANFNLADLEQARFLNINIEGADFSGAKFDNASLYNCTADGSDFSSVTGENIAVRESSFQEAKLNRFTARCAHFRDCNLTRADLHGAYLYRAMITGDPPKAMSMNNANLSATTLVQSYIAGDLSGADLRGALLVYARLNQIILNDADLTGASLFGASLVKSLFERACMDDVVGPVFSDRCTGLQQALEEAQGDESRKLAAFTASLEELLKQQQRGST